MFWIDDVDPTEIQGCVTWLDFTDRSTLAFSTGTSISQIKDKSGKNNHYLQAVQANQATWTGTYNGRTCARFQNSWMDSALNSTQLGIINSEYTLFVSMYTATAVQVIGMIFANTSLAENYEMHTGLIGYGARFIPASTIYVDVNSPQASDGNQHVLCGMVSGGYSYMFTDNVQGTPKLGGLSTLNSLLRIGARFNTNLRFDGHIACIVIYNRSLTSTERSAIIKMLQRY